MKEDSYMAVARARLAQCVEAIASGDMDALLTESVDVGVLDEMFQGCSDATDFSSRLAKAAGVDPSANPLEAVLAVDWSEADTIECQCSYFGHLPHCLKERASASSKH